MSDTIASISALEWFFRKPSASNFPQDTSSPELRQLSTAAKQLSIALSTAELNAAELSKQATIIREWVDRVEATDRVGNAEIRDLTLKISESIELVRKSTPAKVPKGVGESLNATVIALVILAKSSQDIRFRNEVIALAKNLVPPSVGATQEEAVSSAA